MTNSTLISCPASLTPPHPWILLPFPAFPGETCAQPSCHSGFCEPLTCGISSVKTWTCRLKGKTILEGRRFSLTVILAPHPHHTQSLCLSFQAGCDSVSWNRGAVDPGVCQTSDSDLVVIYKVRHLRQVVSSLKPQL